MKIQNVKGTYDYLTKEQRIRSYINNILKETFEEYGYYEIETPILCFYDMLSDKYDENNDILKEIYRLKDQGERDLGLRYDLTVPFAKLIALNKNTISFPFKRYEISKVFRDGPIKKGRDREFTQCDIDVVGIKGQFIEAELLSIYKKVFDKLNIDITVYYNSRNLMNGLILEAGVKEELVPNVTTILDKKEKITKEEMSTLLKEIGLNNKQIDNINKYFNMNLDELLTCFKDTNNEDIKTGLNEINTLSNYIKELDMDNMCLFNISLARGQNYYTGCIFEVFDNEKRVASSIGGGGRYDNIIGNFINDGNEYPAVGISFGLSSIYEIIKDEELFNSKSQTDIYIIPIDTDIEALKLANKLRDMNYNVEIEMNNRKLKKSMDYANKERIPYVIVLGQDEIDNKCFKIKDMFNNKEINITDLNEIKKLYE